MVSAPGAAADLPGLLQRVPGRPGAAAVAGPPDAAARSPRAARRRRALRGEPHFGERTPGASTATEVSVGGAQSEAERAQFKLEKLKIKEVLLF